MFENIKFAYLNHKSRVDLLTRVEGLSYLYKSIRSVFELLLIFNMLISVLLFTITWELGIFNLLSMILLIPIYYKCIKLTVYTLIWASKHLTIKTETITDFEV